jgi:hypothetical protein
MTKKFQKTLLAVAIIATFTSGCRSTQEYKKFAEAGNNFTEANNALLDTAENITVDTTSERLLSDRNNPELNSSNDRRSAARYEELSKQDIERLELIAELRKHNQLLQDYFSTLIELAGSDSPEKTQKSVDNIALQLQNSGVKLINFGKIGKLFPVTKIVLDARIRGAIRKELERRKEMIYREISIQEESLKILSESMEHDIKVMRKLQEFRLVIKPLLQPGDMEENDWIEARNNLMIQDDSVILAIKKAKGSLGKFKAMFIASVEGELTSKSLKQFIQETNSFSELVLNKH